MSSSSLFSWQVPLDLLSIAFWPISSALSLSLFALALAWLEFMTSTSRDSSNVQESSIASSSSEVGSTLIPDAFSSFWIYSWTSWLI